MMTLPQCKLFQQLFKQILCWLWHEIYSVYQSKIVKYWLIFCAGTAVRKI